MRTIHKFKMPFGEFDMVLPMGTRIRHIGMQSGEMLPQMWVELDPSDSGQLNILHRYMVLGTGREFPEYLTYLGTFLVDDGKLVWHLYENEPKQAPAPYATPGALQFKEPDEAKAILAQVEEWTKKNTVEAGDGATVNVSRASCTPPIHPAGTS
jgi:hypothetical protein